MKTNRENNDDIRGRAAAKTATERISGRQELDRFIDANYSRLTSRGLETLLCGATGVVVFLMYRPTKEKYRQLIDKYLTGEEHPLFIYEDDINDMMKQG